MITGAHVILYTKDADADRAFIKDTLAFPHVDVGHGWLIFALPPAEVAMHPVDGASEGGTSRSETSEASHELYLMCDDVKAFVADMQKRGLACSEIHEQPWGSLVNVTLPSGTELGVYEPKHASPKWGAPKRATAPKKSSAKKKSAPKKKAASKPKPAPRKKSAAKKKGRR